MFGRLGIERRASDRRVDAEPLPPEFLALLKLCGGEARASDDVTNTAAYASRIDGRSKSSNGSAAQKNPFARVRQRTEERLHSA
jgi:hypothetical protein